LSRSKIHKREVRQLAADGLSCRQISLRLGVTHSRVWQVCQLLGVKTQGRAGYNHGHCWPGTIEANKMRGRIQAMQKGWPQAANATQAEILCALYRRGPLAVAEMLPERDLSHVHRALLPLRRAGLVVLAGKRGRQSVWRIACGLKPGSELGGARHG
jgi:hypothetical protein